MSKLVAIEGTRADSLNGVLERAKGRLGEADGVVVLMQLKEGGLAWFAPDEMKLETLIFYLWTAINNIGR